jgi:hypothetical protein
MATVVGLQWADEASRNLRYAVPSLAGAPHSPPRHSQGRVNGSRVRVTRRGYVT